jgi:xylulokinase
MPSDLVLGFDSSTQGITAVILDPASGAVVHSHAINFDQALPQYGTRHGVLPNPDPSVVHGSPLLWLEALEKMLDHLKTAVDLSRVSAIAGSAQQHGSVYLGDGFPAALAALDPGKPLAAQLAACLTRATAPVWMDSSTGEDCRAIEAALDGADAVAAISGSAAYERFTGPQIRRFYRLEPAAYQRTAHIRLISAFLCSVLAGKPAPTDLGDGSGMNLLDLGTRAWHPRLLEATAPDLARRLAPASASTAVVGTASAWLTRRYGVPAGCTIMPWSGDNPCSAVGLGLVEDGALAISLGTSDTLFAVSKARPVMPPGGHVFFTPTGDHMALFCYSNGSLAREAVRDRHHLDWAGFSAALARTRPGNAGRLMLPWFKPEIVPRVAKANVVRRGFAETDADAEVRAVVEAQMVSMRRRADAAGVKPSALRATGGAASNRDILQIAADVFQLPIRRSEITNTAALGAAVRAAHALAAQRGKPAAWGDLARLAVEPKLAPAVEPRKDTAAAYADLAKAQAALEAEALKA